MNAQPITVPPPNPVHETNRRLDDLIEELKGQRDEQRARAEAAEQRGDRDRAAAAAQHLRDSRRFWIATAIAAVALLVAVAAWLLPLR